MPHVSGTTTSILAVIVLYQRDPAQSQSVSSLCHILNENAELAKQFSLVLYDNSPQPQSHALTAVCPIHYVHDSANGGLASAYNFALVRAESEQRTWLLLLDQDTTLTRDFLFELVETAKTLPLSSPVAAILPKLTVNGVVHSPAIPFLQQIRRQFLPHTPPIGRDVVGVLQQRMCSYNSGSTLRVSALRAVGGFPAEYWLDFLDHAVFQALFIAGYRVYLMLATLVHDASYTDMSSVPLWRSYNVLAAQMLYVKQNGNFLDRLLYRIWLLRLSKKLRRSCPDPRVWKEAVREALLFRMPEVVRPIPPDARE